VKARETAFEGYRRALAVHQEVAARQMDPAITEAVERQPRAIRALSLRAFLELESVVDNPPAPIEQARAEQRQAADALHAWAARAGRQAAPEEAGSPTATTTPRPASTSSAQALADPIAGRDNLGSVGWTDEGLADLVNAIEEAAAEEELPKAQQPAATPGVPNTTGPCRCRRLHAPAEWQAERDAKRVR
jgi:hypothetical protein